MQALPTDAVMAIDRARPTPGDAVTNALDPPEFLDVQMQQFAGMSPLIAHDRDGRIERPQAIEAEPTQDLAHRRDRQAELPRDCRRAEALPAQSFNCASLSGAVEPRAPVLERAGAARSPAPNPFAYRLLADARVSRDFHDLLTGSDAVGHQVSIAHSCGCS